MPKFWEHLRIYHYVPEKINSALNDKYIEHKSKGDENISIKQHLEKITSYLCNMTYDLRASSEWKICLTIKINFMLSKNGGES